MEQLNISRLFDRLMQDRNTVKSEPKPAGTYNFTYLRNPHLRLAALVFTHGALTSKNDVAGIVIFNVNPTFKKLVEVTAAWVDSIHSSLPFAMSVQNFCSAMFGSYSVPFDHVANSTAFALVGQKNHHVYDADTGLIVPEWAASDNGVQTNDGIHHERLTLVRLVGDPVRSLHLVESKNVNTFTA